MSQSLIVWAFFFLALHELLVSWLAGGTRKKVRGLKTFLLHPLTIERLSGIVVLGILPLIVATSIDHPSFFAFTDWPSYSITSLLVYGIFVLLLVLFTSWQYPRMEINRFQSVLRFTPEIRRWGMPNLVIWVLYLIAYEWILRGLMLYGSIEWMGVPAAVALNCAVYAVIHIHKGWEQIVGALPFGLLLCWVTLQSGSIWPAYLLHLILSLSMEVYVIRYYRNQKSYQTACKTRENVVSLLDE